MLPKSRIWAVASRDFPNGGFVKISGGSHNIKGDHWYIAHLVKLVVDHEHPKTRVNILITRSDCQATYFSFFARVARSKKAFDGSSSQARGRFSEGGAGKYFLGVVVAVDFLAFPALTTSAMVMGAGSVALDSVTAKSPLAGPSAPSPSLVTVAFDSAFF
jgi:hypothetical protein